MNTAQRLNEIRKELVLNERLAKLLIEFAADYAGVALRKSYTTNDPAQLIRQSAYAEGAEKFVAEITKTPVAAAPERPA